MEIDAQTLAVLVVAIPVVVSTFFDGLAKVVAAIRGTPRQEPRPKKTDNHSEE